MLAVVVDPVQGPAWLDPELQDSHLSEGCSASGGEILSTDPTPASLLQSIHGLLDPHGAATLNPPEPFIMAAESTGDSVGPLSTVCRWPETLPEMGTSEARK